ncbi:hypothetical protein EYF80_024305 [Liparis tanakae]|uniref:Uncharacterized protein n=1 Tax=Liparis tanakae TaxID=230148 RepID=A0A4Z2HI82_9TELE|nr:hypothetical protein EYF80_024305 [Liparis tanakae]
MKLGITIRAHPVVGESGTRLSLRVPAERPALLSAPDIEVGLAVQDVADLIIQVQIFCFRQSTSDMFVMKNTPSFFSWSSETGSLGFSLCGFLWSSSELSINQDTVTTKPAVGALGYCIVATLRTLVATVAAFCTMPSAMPSMSMFSRNGVTRVTNLAPHQAQLSLLSPPVLTSADQAVDAT